MRGNKRKILIVDDSELNRALLADMLSDRFDILEAENGMEAMTILHEHELEISLMLLERYGFSKLCIKRKPNTFALPRAISEYPLKSQ